VSWGRTLATRPKGALLELLVKESRMQHTLTVMLTVLIALKLLRAVHSSGFFLEAVDDAMAGVGFHSLVNYLVNYLLYLHSKREEERRRRKRKLQTRLNTCSYSYSYSYSHTPSLSHSPQPFFLRAALLCSALPSTARQLASSRCHDSARTLFSSPVVRVIRTLHPTLLGAEVTAAQLPHTTCFHFQLIMSLDGPHVGVWRKSRPPTSAIAVTARLLGQAISLPVLRTVSSVPLSGMQRSPGSLSLDGYR
jgi:hypothetical protein